MAFNIGERSDEEQDLSSSDREQDDVNDSPCKVGYKGKHTDEDDEDIDDGNTGSAAQKVNNGVGSSSDGRPKRVGIVQ